MRLENNKIKNKTPIQETKANFPALLETYILNKKTKDN